MCTLFTYPSNSNSVWRQLLLADPPDWIPAEAPPMIYSYARPLAPIILGDGKCVEASWTYQPPLPDGLSAEEKKKQGWKVQTFNTKGEEAFVKVTWADAIKNRHCVVPAVAFTEHQHRGPKGKTTVPYKMRFAGDEAFLLAGIWKRWDDGVYRFSILTTKPNKLQRWVHNSNPRQPVILRVSQAAQYLDAKTPEKLLPFLIPRDDDGLVADVGVNLNGLPTENPPDSPEWDDTPLEMPVMQENPVTKW